MLVHLFMKKKIIVTDVSNIFESSFLITVLAEQLAHLHLLGTMKYFYDEHYCQSALLM